MKQVVVVAGASGGVGSQVCEELKSYYRVIGIGRAELSREPVDYEYLQIARFDASELRRVQEDKIGGNVWAVVNCAGSVINAPIWKLTTEQWGETVDANLTSCFSLLSVFAPLMRQAGAGRFVFLSSVVARRGSFGASHYAAAKGGIEALVRSSSIELGPTNVTVNAIALGYMDSGMISMVPEDLRSKLISEIPQHRLGPTAEVGPLVRFLLSPEASYISGATIDQSGGL